MLNITNKIKNIFGSKDTYSIPNAIKNSGDVILWCLQSIPRPIRGLYRENKSNELIRVTKIDIDESIEKQYLYVVVDTMQGRHSIPFCQLVKNYSYLSHQQDADVA